MTEIAASRTLDIGARKVRIRELTLGEIRGWMARLEARDPDKAVDLVDELLFDGLSIDDLTLMSDLARDDLDSILPTDLAKLANAIKETNSHFFALRGRLVNARLATAQSG